MSFIQWRSSDVYSPKRLLEVLSGELIELSFEFLEPDKLKIIVGATNQLEFNVGANDLKIGLALFGHAVQSRLQFT